MITFVIQKKVPYTLNKYKVILTGKNMTFSVGEIIWFHVNPSIAYRVISIMSSITSSKKNSVVTVKEI